MDQGTVDGKVRDGAANANRGVFFDLNEPTHECGNLRKSDSYSNHNTVCLFPVASGWLSSAACMQGLTQKISQPLLFIAGAV